MCGAGLDRERLRRETPRATRLRTSPAPHVPPRRDGGMLLAPIPSARAQDPLFAIGSAARRSALRVVPWRMSCHHCAAHPWLSLSRVPPSSAGWVAGPLPLPHTPTICTSTKSAKYRRVAQGTFRARRTRSTSSAPLPAAAKPQTESAVPCGGPRPRQRLRICPIWAGTGAKTWGINNSGVIVGNSRVSASDDSRAFRWTAGAGMIDLGVTGNVLGQDTVATSTAEDINNNGVESLEVSGGRAPRGGDMSDLVGKSDRA